MQTSPPLFHLQSHSVHPLMRLSPKLSQRRKKVLLLVRKLKFLKNMLTLFPVCAEINQPFACCFLFHQFENELLPI